MSEASGAPKGASSVSGVLKTAEAIMMRGNLKDPPRLVWEALATACRLMETRHDYGPASLLKMLEVENPKAHDALAFADKVKMFTYAALPPLPLANLLVGRLNRPAVWADEVQACLEQVAKGTAFNLLRDQLNTSLRACGKGPAPATVKMKASAGVRRPGVDEDNALGNVKALQIEATTNNGGDPNLPTDYANKRMRSLVVAFRTMHRNGIMPARVKEKLEDMGFLWDGRSRPDARPKTSPRPSTTFHLEENVADQLLKLHPSRHVPLSDIMCAAGQWLIDHPGQRPDPRWPRGAVNTTTRVISIRFEKEMLETLNAMVKTESYTSLAALLRSGIQGYLDDREHKPALAAE